MRDRIVEAAGIAFRRSGYAAKTEDIADLAGVSRQTVYNYFKNKDELYKAVIALIVDRAVQSDLSMSLDRSMEEVLRDFAYGYWRTNITVEALEFSQMSIPVTKDRPDLGRMIQECGPGRSIPMLANHLRERMAQAEIDQGDADAIAEGFIGAITGHSRFRFFNSLGLDTLEERQPAIDTMIRIFLVGLGYRRA